MIGNKKINVLKQNIDVPKRNIASPVAVIRADETGRVLTVGDGHIRRTIEHETRLGSVVVGEFTDLRIAERAAPQPELGWRQCPDARKTG